MSERVALPRRSLEGVLELGRLPDAVDHLGQPRVAGVDGGGESRDDEQKSESNLFVYLMYSTKIVMVD